MKHIFISSSFSQEKELISKLKKVFKSLEIEVIHPVSTSAFEDDQSSQINSAIHSSDTVIALLCSNRPNDLYELGYAMGAGKNVLLIAESDAIIPSNLQNLPCIKISKDQKTTINEILRSLNQFEDIRHEPKRSYNTAEEKLMTYFTDPSYFESINGHTFEKLVIELLSLRGYTVKEIFQSNRYSYNFDFLIESSDGRIIIVEAKKFSRQSKVSVMHIQKLLAATVHIKANSGMFISSSDFTSSAVSLATSAIPELILVTMKKLLEARNENELLGINEQALNILLVEDNIINQKIAAHLLQREGHIIKIATNGKEAISDLENENFDIVLMDIQMPKMDSIKTTAAIREKERHENIYIPIIAMTPSLKKKDREQYFELGIDEVISKPIKSEDLIRVIENLTSKKEKATME